MSLLANITQGFYLCNVVPRVLRQHWTGFFPAMLSEAFWTTLDKDFNLYFACAFQIHLRQHICLAQENYLCNVSPKRKNAFLQKNNLCNVVTSICLCQHCTRKHYLCTMLIESPRTTLQSCIVLIYVDQHCTKILPVLCWPMQHG